MSKVKKDRAALDLSHLPTYGFGRKMTPWWGELCFVAIETMGFALACGAYLYLALKNDQWPIGAAPPELLWATLLTLWLLVSLWPNWITKVHARAEDRRKVRRDLVIMSVIGLVPLVLRAYEFSTLNVRWDQNAYGSIVWIILGLHTVHLITDVVDTFVLTALMFTRHGHGKRFSDVEDNAMYWDFVVISWLPIYVLLYGFPRLWSS